MAGEGKGAIAVAVIGCVGLVIAAVITAVVGFWGQYAVQERAISTTATAEALHLTQTAQVNVQIDDTTDTPIPTATPTSTMVILQATYTPETKPPTYTNTPTTQPTVIVQSTPTDTPPGTVLQVGETWISKGLYVKLDYIQFAFGDQADMSFTFTNQTDRAINLYFNHDTHVTMKDDKGNVYTWDYLYEENASINPGSWWNDRVLKGGDLSRASYFIIQLEIPGIISAQWKY